MEEINSDPTQPESININAYRFKLGNNTIGIFHEGTAFGLSLPNGTQWSFLNQNGKCTINSTVIDSRIGKVIEIIDNEIVINTGLYDIEFSGGRLTIRNAPRDIILVVGFKGDEGEILVTGRLEYAENRCIDVTDRGIYCSKQMLVSNCVFNAPKSIGMKIVDEGHNDGEMCFGSSILRNIANVESCSFGARGDTGIIFTTDFLDSVAANGYNGGATYMMM